MFSKKITERASSLRYNKSDSLFKKSFQVKVHLQNLNVDIEFEFNTQTKDELLLSDISYKTSLSGEYLAVLDAFIEIIDNKPVEAIDRVSIKELDYFLRDTNAEPAFKFYNKELYEILSTGEEIQKTALPKVEEYSLVFDPSANGDFFDLSFSEQIDLIEEVSAKHFYCDLNFEGLYIECLDISDRCIELSLSSGFTKHQSRIESLISTELCLSNYNIAFKA